MFDDPCDIKKQRALGFASESVRASQRILL